MLGTLVRSETNVVLEPIVAWRAWTLTGHRNGTGLRLRPISGSPRPWPPLEPAHGTCRRRRLHLVPGMDCTCGLHAMHDPDPLRRARNPAVIGTAALWGRVVEHEYGYRGEFAYPQRLRLVCHLCLWRKGAAGDRCAVVVRLSGGRLVPLCDEHLELSRRYAYPMPRLLPARDIEQGLRSTYRVDAAP